MPEQESDPTSDWTITVSAFDMTPAQAEALFIRVADAAHALNERITVGMSPPRTPL